MFHPSSASTLLPRGVLAMLFAVACGGSAFSQAEGEGGSGPNGKSGESGKGGSRSGGAGSTGQGGSAGTASAGSGGASTAGSASAGSTSMGGSVGRPGQCTLPPESGNCDAYFQRWHHDPESGICRPFIYGGCGGNANNYESLAQCQKACSGGTPNYDACEKPTDCAVAGPGCCGTCDGPGLTAHDLIAYATKDREAVFAVCALVDIACAACAEPQPHEQQLKHFIPDCVQGQCVVHDIRTSSVTACKTELDCYLRSGTHCCQSCDGDQMVAVNHSGGLEKLVCGDMPPPCAACEPQLGPGAAYCDPTGHCAVGYAIPLDNPTPF